MQKETKLILIGISLILILSMSFVSAGFFSDFFNKLFGDKAEITGRPVGGGEDETCRCAGLDVIIDSCEAGSSPNCEFEGCMGCVCVQDFYECEDGDCCDLEDPCSVDYGSFLVEGLMCPGTTIVPMAELKCGGTDPGNNGICGSSIMQRSGTKKRECTGNSEICPTSPNQGYTEYWDEWEINESCTATEECKYIAEEYSCQVDEDCLGLNCGNGGLDYGENCDDGNTANNDGCSSICVEESGWDCGGTPSVCSENCHDGLIVGDEECDDGNYVDGGDGCSACLVEDGWGCTGEPSVCSEICGNGVIDSGETCDDGGSIDEDGCSSDCLLEDGWSCTGTPNVCSEICNDGLIVGNEGCDDGNSGSGDGCSSICVIEDGYVCLTAGQACINCDEDGDGHTSTSGDCEGLAGEDCNDNNIFINPGISEAEYCSDEIDNDCDALVDTDDGDCDPDCPDADSDGYSDGACGGSDCNDSNSDINPGVDENCISDLDYDCDEDSFNGCVFHYYSINELKISTRSAVQDAEIPIACLFEIKSSAESSRILEPVNVNESCIRASVSADFSKCEFLKDTQDNSGLYHRTFKCDVGAVGVNKQVRCAVNTNVCSALTSPNGFPSSEPVTINVTTVDFDFTEQRINRIRSLSGEIKKFALRGSTHELKIISIFSNSIKLTISSDPVNVTLSIGNRVKVDLDGDGINDIEIILIEIIDGEAVLDMEALEEISGGCIEGSMQACGTYYDGTQFCANNAWSACSYDSVGGSNEGINTDTGLVEEEGSTIWVYVLIVIIFLLIVIIAIFFMKKKLSKMLRPSRGPVKSHTSPPRYPPRPRSPPPRRFSPRSPPPPRRSPPRGY